MRRWLCPDCGGCRLAPDRPRKNDVRRYCLRCSERTGRLVERTCPTLDQERQARAARQATKAARARATAADRERVRRTIGDVDLLDEARRIWRLPAMVELRERTARHSRLRWLEPRAAPVPTISFRRKTAQSPEPDWTSGYCMPSAQQITMTVGLEPAGAVYALLHELVHAAAPSGWHHSESYRTWLMAVAAEAYPDAEFRFSEVNGRESTYALGVRITDGIRRIL